MKISEKRQIGRLLATSPLPDILTRLRALPAAAVINPLFAGICHADSTTRWHAIMAMGDTVPRLAERNMEEARIVMRRFMWSLNDESGGIGWGAPESFAEIVAGHDGLAKEYGHMLVAYMREDGFFLEYAPLQRGLMWGLGRVAEKRPQLLQEWDADLFLPLYLESEDSTVQGLAARTLGLLGIREGVVKPLGKIRLANGFAQRYIPDQDAVVATPVRELVAAALKRLDLPAR